MGLRQTSRRIMTSWPAGYDDESKGRKRVFKTDGVYYNDSTITASRKRTRGKTRKTENDSPSFAYPPVTPRNRTTTTSVAGARPCTGGGHRTSGRRWCVDQVAACVFRRSGGGAYAYGSCRTWRGRIAGGSPRWCGGPVNDRNVSRILRFSCRTRV